MRQKFVEHHTGSEQVGARADRQALDLFRRHVAWRADHRARHRAIPIRFGQPCDAEVGQLDAPAGLDHHVGGLDVAVYDAAFMRIPQRVEQLAHDAHRLRQVKVVVVLEVRRQLATADELHHQVGHPVLLAKVEHGDDVGVVQPPGCLRLTHKTRRVLVGHRLVEHVTLQDGLHRHRAFELRIESLVHQAHCATTDHALEPIAAQLGQWLVGVHRGRVWPPGVRRASDIGIQPNRV